MKSKSYNYCIIPARGGSKSIPSKNIKKLGNFTLIEYSILVAIKANVFDKIIVTSDSQRILQIAKKYKEVCCIKRPKYLSTDAAKTESAIIHACKYIQKKQNLIPNLVFTLEPTSPFRKIKTIKNSIHLMEKYNVDSVITVAESDKCFGKIKNKKFFHNIKNVKRRRQDRKKLLYETGTLYVSKYEKLLKYNSVLGKSIAPLVVNGLEVIDINEPFDFYLAEAVVKQGLYKIRR